MRKIPSIVTILAIGIIFLSAKKPETNNPIIGTWQMVKSITNGKPTPGIMTDRIQEFHVDHTFESKLYLPDGIRTYNKGQFLLANDSTIVTIHHDEMGNPNKVAFMYQFAVQNDSLHLFGFYMNGTSVPGQLQMVHIDEWWIRLVSED